MFYLQINGLNKIQDISFFLKNKVNFFGLEIDTNTKNAISIYTFKNLASQIKEIAKNTYIIAIINELEENKIQQIIDTNLVDIIQFRTTNDLNLISKFYLQKEIWKEIVLPKNTKEKDKSNLQLIVEYLEKYKHSCRKFVIDTKNFSTLYELQELSQLINRYSYEYIISINKNDDLDFILKMFEPEIVDITKLLDIDNDTLITENNLKIINNLIN